MNRPARMIFLVLAGLLGGCATAPKQAHVEASSAVRAASEVIDPATPTPEANAYLLKARDHIRVGEELLAQADYEGARLHFERGEADAETALALARAYRAEDQAQRAEAQLEGTDTVAKKEANDVD